MGLLDWFRTKQPPTLTHVFEERAAMPDFPLYSPTLATASQYGITDTDAPDVEEQRTAYRGLVYRLVQQRADAISVAMQRAKVVRQTGDDEYEPVESAHPWKTIIRHPSPHADAFSFWANVSQLRDLGRGSFMYVARGVRGVPDCFHVIFPDFGEVFPQGDTTGGIAGYRFYATGNSGYTDIPPNDMVWLRHRHPVSPYESASLIEAAAYQSDKDLYLQVYGRDSLRDGNDPSIYVSFKEPLAQAQMDAYQAGFQQYRTVGKSKRKIPILAGGGELKTVGISPDDLQYIETAALNAKELMWIFGFKPSMFEDSGVVANSRELRRAWYQDSIQPEVDKLCADMTHQLRAAFGTIDDTLCIKAPDVVPSDPLEEAKLYEVEIRSGTRKPGDVIAMRGEDVPAELDQYFMSGGLRPVVDMMREPEAQELPL